MCSRLTAIFADVDIICIGLAGKDHVSGAVGASIIGVCGDIIQELLYCFVVGVNGGGLLLSEFAE